MVGEDYKSFSDLEVIQILNKRKKRYSAIFLHDLEEEVQDKELFRKIRKSFLDNINGFTRSIFIVIGIDIEGLEDK